MDVMVKRGSTCLLLSLGFGIIDGFVLNFNFAEIEDYYRQQCFD